MKPLNKKVWIGTWLLAMGLSAVAQGTAPPSPAGTMPREGGMASRPMQPHDPERIRQRMAERHTKHMEALKAKLQLRADQESAWASYQAAMQPPQAASTWMRRGELEKLSTPERIDRINQQMAEHQETMRKHGEATKAFYAVLDDTQKKIFDKEMFIREQRGPERRP